MPVKDIAISITPGIDPWKSIYRIGGISAILAIIGTIVDIAYGIITGGEAADIPRSALGYFIQLQDHRILGLYHLDFLNYLNTFVSIPSYLALLAAHHRTGRLHAVLIAVFYCLGSTVFLANNSALPMLQLSGKYHAAAPGAEQSLFLAAGENLLAKGAHGSYGAFPGFFILSCCSLAISLVMLRGKVFSRATAIMGIVGSSTLIIYLVLTTFVPDTAGIAMMKIGRASCRERV